MKSTTMGYENNIMPMSSSIMLLSQDISTDMYLQFPSVTESPAENSLNDYFNTSMAAWNGSIYVNENDTLNSTNITKYEPLGNMIFMGITSIVLGLMILLTVIGNVFVIAAILLERNLQNVANYLIVSLAVADLMVACLVMPLGAVYEISRGWILGPELCEIWTSSDVLCCTASILHLVAIAVDRYWAVTNVDYIHNRNSGRIFAMIIIVWAVALIVSLAPQFGWKDPDYLDRINKQQRCLVSQDIAYQIFATCSTFYVPLLVILVLYWKIFQTARKRIRRRQDQGTSVIDKSKKKNNKTCTYENASDNESVVVTSDTKCAKKNFLMKRRFLHRIKKTPKHKKFSAAEALVASLVTMESTTSADACEDQNNTHSSNEVETTTAFTISTVNLESNIQSQTHNQISDPQANTTPSVKSLITTTNNNGSENHRSHIIGINKVETLSKDNAPQEAAVQHVPSRREKRETLEAKRERKAAKTLAIITGAFVVCWLPFFIMALLMPLCEACEINQYIASLFLWLGYFNSTLNPIIYTIFSPEFRQAFKRILCGKHRRRGARSFRSTKFK